MGSRSRQMIEVFTDGSCQGSNFDDRNTGIGVHFPGGEFSDLGIPCLSKKCQTNQSSELYAIQVALETINQDPAFRNAIITVKTDSMYAINCVTKWVQKWRTNGWKTSNDTDVLNREIIEAIDQIIGKRTVLFQHIAAHTNRSDPDSVGNAIADSLANQGARVAGAGKQRRSKDRSSKTVFRQSGPKQSNQKPSARHGFVRTTGGSSPIEIVLSPDTIDSSKRHRTTPAKNYSQKRDTLTIELLD